MPPLRFGVWVVSRVTLAGSALCPLADLGGPVGWAGYRRRCLLPAVTVEAGETSLAVMVMAATGATGDSVKKG